MIKKMLFFIIFTLIAESSLGTYYTDEMDIGIPTMVVVDNCVVLYGFRDGTTVVLGKNPVSGYYLADDIIYIGDVPAEVELPEWARVEMLMLLIYHPDCLDVRLVFYKNLRDQYNFTQIRKR